MSCALPRLPRSRMRRPTLAPAHEAGRSMSRCVPRMALLPAGGIVVCGVATGGGAKHWGAVRSARGVRPEGWWSIGGDGEASPQRRPQFQGEGRAEARLDIGSGTNRRRLQRWRSAAGVVTKSTVSVARTRRPHRKGGCAETRPNPNAEFGSSSEVCVCVCACGGPALWASSRGWNERGRKGWSRIG